MSNYQVFNRQSDEKKNNHENTKSEKILDRIYRMKTKKVLFDSSFMGEKRGIVLQIRRIRLT
jgi:hypothetical protein